MSALWPFALVLSTDLPDQQSLTPLLLDTDLTKALQ